jgi:hypothetical protein
MRKTRPAKDDNAEKKAKAERLVKARYEAGFAGAVSAAKHFNWPENNYKAHEAGRNGFGPADAKKYSTAFRVRLPWLVLNEPPMREPGIVPLGQEFPPDPDPDGPATIGSQTGVRGIPPGAVPQIDVRAGMGGGGVTLLSEGVPGKNGATFSADQVRDYWRLPGEVVQGMGLKLADIAILPVQGDSMATTLMEGDYVLVDTKHRLPSPDGVYALGDEFGGIVVKRLEVVAQREDDTIVRVISDNPRHAPKERQLSEMYIVGRVLRKFGIIG